ncbi:MAG: UDP-N-acetylmuramate dehydrogenase [Patescibacteria group bacterium]
MIVEQNVVLAQHTSLGVGGLAENYILANDAESLLRALKTASEYSHLWLLGYGSNCLISDQGLPGLVIHTKGGDVIRNNDLLIVDAGVDWDELVQKSVDEGLWGIELMSGIPGSVGAGVRINIRAYGQSLSDHLEWAKAYDLEKQEVVMHRSADLDWGYKKSFFQTDAGKDQIIIQAAFKLKREPTIMLSYQPAIDYAAEHNIPDDTLPGRRRLILDVRSEAGSLLTGDPVEAKTAGSFFRNPIVTPEQAERVIRFDETGRTADQVKKMNQSHGGDSMRVSAAHVMLAAGYNRGDTWGRVRLHPDHVLKIENANNATAQEIYDVANEIVQTCEQKLGITLEPEVEIMGEFR